MSNKVTYAEIIEALSGKTGFSKQKSEAFAKALVAEIKEELQKNGKASITNFGSFKVKDVAERQGQNPQTGEPITIPAHKRVTFTPYKALRKEVNANYAHLESELIGEKKEKPEAKSEAVPEIFEEAKLVGAHVESEPDIEKDEIAEEEPRSFDRRERARGNNVGLIMVAVLVLVVIGLASAWFLLGTDEQEQTVTGSTAQTEQESISSISDETEQEDIEQQEMEESVATEANTEETVPATDESTEIYQVQQNEWYWVISRKVYGKAHFWPLIFEANFNRNTHPDSLETGIPLKIPILSGSADKLTAEDYARLASGATLVSSAYENFGRLDKAKEYARYAEKWVGKSRP